MNTTLETSRQRVRLLRRAGRREPRRVSIERRGILLVSVWLATTWWQRLRGLFAYPQLLSKANSSQALLLSPCSSVHSFFLGRAIDVVFLCKENVVLKCVSLNSNRVAFCVNAHSALELPSGATKQLTLCVGDQLVVGRSFNKPTHTSGDHSFGQLDPQPYPQELRQQPLVLETLFIDCCINFPGTNR